MGAAGIKSFILLELFIVLLCSLGIYQIHEKASLPFMLDISGDHLCISSVFSKPTTLQEGDLLISVDEMRFNSAEEMEVLLDGKRIGEKVEIVFERAGKEYSDEIILTNYYTGIDLITYAVCGFLFLITGTAVLIRSNRRRAAKLFFWGCSSAALLITMTSGSYVVINPFTGYAARFIFHLAYSFTPVIFVHFILNFPEERKNSFSLLIKLAYLFSILLTLTLSVFFTAGAYYNSVEEVSLYVWLYHNVLRVFVIINFLFAIIFFCRSYLKTKSVPEKQKLKWILLGFIIGPLSYIIFWVLPYLLAGKGLLPEYTVIGLLSAVPVTFAIAIIKYRFFDIDIIFNRSVVYLIVITALVIFYLVLSAAVTYSVKGIDDSIPALISVSAAALALNPVRRKVQVFVDKKFFRVQYNYREALKKFLEEIDTCLNEIQLAENIVKRINEIIPAEKIGFFELQTAGDKIKLIAQLNYDFLLNRVITFKRWKLKTTLSKPIALTSLVEDGVDIEPGDQKVFNRCGMALVFPFKSGNNDIFGFLVLGKKKSGTKFTMEDIDLLNAVKSKAATILERNKYQKELVLEHLEKERLEELNRIKSFIVSRVSHDFRNPLASISMFTDLLLSNENYPKEKISEYIRLINAQNNRLIAMTENVLDFSKIESGTFEYHFEEVDLNELVEIVVKSLHYQLELSRFEFKINLSNSRIIISADKPGIEAVLVNLISNAMKYSVNNKCISLSTGTEGSMSFVSVKDEGIGIPKEDLDSIFNPFLRGHNIDQAKIKGAGLGLTIVKHIMDAHKGKIEVESEIDKGTKFTLRFYREAKGKNS